jgi:hypothetical protein
MATTEVRRDAGLFTGCGRLGVALGAFLAVTYLACSIWDGVFSSWAMHGAWEDLLPGFTWWSWGSFFLGLVESFAYGFWFALILPAVRWALHTTSLTRERELTAK